MRHNFIDQAVSKSLNGNLPVFLFLLSLIFGIIAINFMAREEEPQIVVPLVDITVEVPNLSPRQVERQVAVPVEKLLTQIPGVEHIYSTSNEGRLDVTLRFHVGENREDAILNTYNKLYSNQQSLPSVVDKWFIRPVEVDDVPIMMLGLYSTAPKRYSDYELRRFAQEISTLLQGLKDTSEVKVVGGRSRSLQIELDIQALAARKTTALEVIEAIKLSNELKKNTSLTLANNRVLIQSGDIIRSTQELASMVVNVTDGIPILLTDVAQIIDGPDEIDSYQWLEFSANNNHNSQIFDRVSESESSATSSSNLEQFPLVTISVAKQKGSNAVAVSNAVLSKMQEMTEQLLPKEIKIEILRDYGKTADDKVTNLAVSLAFAIFTVVVFIAVFLGWRPAVVVGLAVPVCYGTTLLLDMIFDYTINRVTLFALILSLGLLVDDPITGIDNIERFLKRKGKNSKEKIVDAMSEIRPALLMSTLTIILAFVPLAFITGMMGPYMAPMAFNVPVSVMISTLVAFLITPWLALKILKPHPCPKPSTDDGFYAKILNPLIANKRRAKMCLWFVLALFIITAILPLMRSVPLKLLPFDNKNEIQILIDMPESSSLENTAALTKQVASIVKQFPETNAIAAYVGEASPIDFNGMVRRYYLRNAPHLAELRVTLIDKSLRQHQSHGVVLRLRKMLKNFVDSKKNLLGVSIKIVEVPPGPPVLSTLVAEVYAQPFVSPEQHQLAAKNMMQRLAQEPYVVEIDTSLIELQKVKRFILDKHKAALSGIATTQVNQTIQMAVSGLDIGIYQKENEASPIPIEIKLPYSIRNDTANLLSLMVKGRLGVAKQDTGAGTVLAAQPLVNIAELGHWQNLHSSQPIMRKDLTPVIYVTAEISGRTPAEIIADISSDLNLKTASSNPWQQRNYFNSGGGIPWQLPRGTTINFSGEGEWRITIDVFRDMGIAFAFALVGIFLVLKWQTTSSILALIIMSAIPLTIVGIMPGFWIMNQIGERSIAGAPDPVLFTATAMIGMIALAGIVVRNSLILVEFITIARTKGLTIKEALVEAGKVRMRPVLLTAGTTLLGNLVITLDPVFSGLALAIIFGIIASTIFSLLVVPVVYYLVFTDQKNLLSLRSVS